MSAEPIEFFDRVELPSGVKRDASGNMVVPARVCRTGVYDYAGYELGKPEMRRVRVYRPPEEVFKADAMRSLAGVPVTIGHPRDGFVDTANWKEHAKGEASSDDIVRDGESIRVPFLLRDESAIQAVEDGKHELSPGYTAFIDWTAGQTPEGKEYDAVARNFRYNHLAIVDRARGGSSCRIGDEGVKKVETKLILVDGLSVETTEAGERAILKLSDERKAAIDSAAELRTKLADAEKSVGEKDGEIAALKKQLKDASDPAALQTAATARAKLCDAAKKLFPKVVIDNKTDDEIRQQVVSELLKDAAEGLNEDGIKTAFLTLAATAKVTDGKPTGGSGDQLVASMRGASFVADEGTSKLLDERNKALEARNARFHTASRPQTAEAKE